MKDTQKRIIAYKKALPYMKERVMAVALLLAVSATMMISTTFAWITLSVSPEISGLSTTISANGNLEIALSDVEGKNPKETAVGDGNGSITQTNLKWGNLVNLSHESYGLDYLTLRPASLNTAALALSPLFSVDYSQDGRIDGYQTDFAFSNYNSGAKVFDVHKTTQYGVRAISSVTYSNAHAASFYTKQLESITGSMADAKAKFAAIYENSTYMNTVTALVGIHVSAYMGTDDISCLTHIGNMNKIMTDLGICADAVGQTLVDIANLYLYKELADKGDVASYDSLAYKLADLKENNYNNAFISKYNTKIKGVSLYTSMAKNLQKAVNGLADAQKNEDGDVLWKRDLESVADLLCGMSTATLKEKNVTYWSSHKSEAAKLLLSGDVETASLNGGIIRDLDQMIGEPVLRVENISVPVTLPSDFEISLVAGRTFNLTVNVKTNAAAPHELPTAYNEAYIFANNAASGDRGTPVAADTYGMAIDFWLRTNEENALLMLEGDIRYLKEYVPITGVDANGANVPLYSYKNASNEDVSVYKVTNSDNSVTWYNASTHEVENVGSAVPVAQQEEIKTPIGYEGVNRVWDELDDPNSDYSQLIQNGTSTTQGSGSCYIFYPEGPEDQEQSLHLLEAMSVAFVDSTGKLLGQARMDTASAIEDAGRVIVPLRMELQNPIVVGKDSAGNDVTETYYITPMAQNEPKRITAIIYLDGKSLSNSDVLAAGSINGQLNIQFGLNKMEQAPVKNGPVMKDHYTIRFEHDKFIRFEKYNADTCKIDLEMTLAGTNPGTVTGSFVSYISATQGARQKEFSMTYDEESKTWKATVPFSGPGDFRLRSIQLDGVDILLPQDQMIRVLIMGTAVDSITCSNWGGDGSSQSVMTADASYRQEVILTLGSSSGTIPKVQAVFIGDNGKNVTVDFASINGTVYTGYGNFTSGGTYKLTYVIVDGVYTSLDPTMYKTLTLKLNLRTTVVLGQPVDQGYYDLLEKEGVTKEEIAEYLNLLHNGNGIPGDQNENGLELVRAADGSLSFITDCADPLFIDVRCIITDDQDNILTGLTDVELLYSGGSITNVLDTDAMEENASAGYYAGRFTLESNGVFSFSQVSFILQGRKYTITSAISAPTVTAIQPAPMEYVEQNAYEPLVYNLGMPAEQRLLYIKLKNAAAATLDITLTNGDGETKAPTKVTASEPDANNVTTFAVQVPGDGYWKISNARAKNVFYDGTFYTGTEDAKTWLDIGQWVRDDEIATTYITEATIKVTGDTPKQSYQGAFMSISEVASKTSSPITVSVLGYGGKPLETVMKEVGIEAEVTFELSYAWDKTSVSEYGYSYSGDDSKLPQNVFTSAYDAENHKAVMGEMVFKLAGSYYPTWSISIDAKDNTYDYSYTYTVGKTIPSEFGSSELNAISSIISVTWTAPTLTITATSITGSDFAVDDKASGATNDTVASGSGLCTNYATPPEHKPSGSHNYTAGIFNNGKKAVVFLACTSTKTGTSTSKARHDCNPATVTISLTGVNNVDQAKLSFTAKDTSGNTLSTVHLYDTWATPSGGYAKDTIDTDGFRGFVWTKQSDGSLPAGSTQYVGHIDGDLEGSDRKTAAGILTSKNLTLTSGDVTYSFDCTDIVIENIR